METVGNDPISARLHGWPHFLGVLTAIWDSHPSNFTHYFSAAML